MTAATATAASSGVRYAPEDPDLPKPWRGLVDSKTGYLYFWNPETNVTQYQKPVAHSPATDAPSSKSISSPVQDQRSSQEQSNDYSAHNDGDKSFQGQSNDNSSHNDDDKSFQGPSNDNISHTEDDKSFQGPNNDNSFHNEDDKSIKGINGGSTTDNSVAAGFQTDRDASNKSLGGAAKSCISSSSEGGLSADAYCRRHEITVIGDNVPQPFTTFEATGYPSELLREFRSAGFSAPTAIQAQSWPIALQGRDIVAVAKTGSGKTLGYLLPGFIHLKNRQNNSRMGPTVLVLSPTRELATQIQDEALKFGKTSRISCTCLYGGAPKGPQLKEVDRGVDVVVATPGRLNDILEMGRISLHQVSYMVLDEADRMLDMGFEPQIRKIMKEVPTQRQTLMYTATWPKEVRKIAADLLKDPIQVNIGNVDELVANKSITQIVEYLTSMDKQRRLEQIMRSQEPGSKIIVFCSTKRMCDQLARNLNHNFGAAAIHGDKCQSERDQVLNEFRTGKCPILVATDVAARGLDIKDIRVVVNYDFPTGIEDYVHRIGRTGRAGATGEAYTFFSDQDAKHAPDLVKVLEGASQHVPPGLRGMASSYGGGMGRPNRRWSSGSGGRDGGGGGGGGRYDSGYSGRDGGRGSGGTPFSSRGGGRGNDSNSHDSDRYGQSSYNGSDGGASGSYQPKSFHETMMQAMEKPSLSAGGGNSWSRDRSRSPNRNVD